ncbi:MAG TPA: hypothetical protein VFJ58_22875 [Armatimonadota bacterium]|nr:hypothetical protein [Armatimonadota bacterium]
MTSKNCAGDLTLKGAKLVKWALAGCVLTAVTLVAAAKAPVASRAAASTIESAAKTFTFVIPHYATTTKDQMDKTTDDYRGHQADMINDLKEQLKNRALPDHAKAEVMRLFGSLQATGEIDYLIENINFQEPDGAGLFRSQWRTLYPARQSLEELGPYATRAILDVIGNRRRGVPFDNSEIDGFVEILASIEHPRYAVEMLTDARDAPTNKLARANYEAVLARCTQKWPYGTRFLTSELPPVSSLHRHSKLPE